MSTTKKSTRKKRNSTKTKVCVHQFEQIETVRNTYSHGSTAMLTWTKVNKYKCAKCPVTKEVVDSQMSIQKPEWF